MSHTIDFIDFCVAFDQMNRGENFSRKGRIALFDFLEECEARTGEQIKLDVVGLCDEFEEKPFEEVLKDYDLSSLEELENETTVIWLDDKTILYRVF